MNIISTIRKKFLNINFIRSFFLKRKFLVSGIFLSLKKNKCINFSLKKIFMPMHFKIKLQNTMIHKSRIIIKSGECVLRGQVLIKGNYFEIPIISPTSGYIKIIYFSNNFKFSPFKKIKKIIIYPDGKDSWKKFKSLYDYYKHSSLTLINRIYEAGILGLGGGSFPTFVKFRSAMKFNVKTLVINGIESDPFTSSDSILISEKIDEIILGCKIISHILNLKKIFFSVTKDNVVCINVLKEKILNLPIFKLFIAPPLYPLGSSKILIKKIFGKEIPIGFRSFNIGIIVHNVGTIYAIKRAIIDGEGFTERVITITKIFSSIQKENIWGRIGTPIEHILNIYDIDHDKDSKNILINGSIMGSKIKNVFSHYVSSKTNCIVAISNVKNNVFHSEKECIFCSKCSDVCPVNLLPQKLYWYIKEKNHIKTKEYQIASCIECKNCELVCPSNIPLVSYYKKEKKIIKKKEINFSLKKDLKIRFERHKYRMQIKNQDSVFFALNKSKLKSNKKKSLKETNLLETKKDKKKYIQDAILRVKLKRKI
ncbi:electron transport complex subunit RsxC [Buchnera aphidicola (Mindarus keteleerifoliae)]|uniref:electron transport complex subunit RsxC n=1 Tax=Buchnera aphidicola TaxID=9 RepID=UPI0031B728AD